MEQVLERVPETFRSGYGARFRSSSGKVPERGSRAVPEQILERFRSGSGAEPERGSGDVWEFQSSSEQAGERVPEVGASSRASGAGGSRARFRSGSGARFRSSSGEVLERGSGQVPKGSRAVPPEKFWSGCGARFRNGSGAVSERVPEGLERFGSEIRRGSGARFRRDSESDCRKRFPTEVPERFRTGAGRSSGPEARGLRLDNNAK